MAGSSSKTVADNLDLCPFTVLVDSREKVAFPFSGIPSSPGRSYLVPVKTCYLPTGDYAIEGCPGIAVERKNLADLYGTLGQHRKRFRTEMERLSELDFAAIVIEASLKEIWQPAATQADWRSKLSPRSVEGTIVSWSMRFPKVHWWPCDNRRIAEVRTFYAMRAFWKLTQQSP